VCITRLPPAYTLTLKGNVSMSIYNFKDNDEFIVELKEYLKNNPNCITETLQENNSELIPSWNKGIPCSEEMKIHLSKKLKGRKFSKEWKQKISDSHKGMKKPWIVEHNKSDFMRKVVSCKKPGTSEKMVGNKNHRNDDIVCCPHCSKTGGKTIMMRWHFDKCKMS